MKRLLTLLLLLPCFGFGQALVDTNNLWSIVEKDEFYGPNHLWDTWETYFLKFEGDTTIDTLQYKKLLRTYDSLQVGWTDYGYIREDTNQRVYARINDTTDALIYDFSLNTGDSTVIYEAGWAYPFDYDCPIQIKVDSTDSITLINGKKRKRLYMSSPTIWIEGIGGTIGGLLVHDYCVVGDFLTRELLCFTENDTLKYLNASYTNCNYTNVGITEVQLKNQVRIYPNPTSGIFTVKGTTGTIQVHDLFGRLVLRTKKQQVDISSYPAGIYFVRILSAAEGGEAVRKLILH